MQKEKILLVDGNSIMNRAFYGIPLLANKNGEYTNALYGFLNIVFGMFNRERPKYLAIAFDLPKPTFRHKMSAEYKAGRKIMPDELRGQFVLLKSLLEKMKIKFFEVENFEADDILGSLSRACSTFGLHSIIFSGDRDLLQLVKNDVSVFLSKTSSGKPVVEKYNNENFFELMGVTPTQYIDVKALMGDKSDNILGVPGIGMKTAVKMINSLGNLEEIVLNADSHPEKISPSRFAKTICDLKEQIAISKQLSTIVTDIPLEINIDELQPNDILNDEAVAELNRLELKTFLNKLA